MFNPEPGSLSDMSEESGAPGRVSGWCIWRTRWCACPYEISCGST